MTQSCSDSSLIQTELNLVTRPFFHVLTHIYGQEINEKGKIWYFQKV